MKRLDYFELLSNLFSFKTVSDEQKNEYVLFSQSDDGPIRNIKDRTEFEALENHVHLLDASDKDRGVERKGKRLINQSGKCHEAERDPYPTCAALATHIVCFE